MSKSIPFIIAGIVIVGAGWWYIYPGSQVSENAQNTYLARIQIVSTESSNNGPLPVIKFNLIGTQPASGQQMSLDLVDPKTARSIEVRKKLQFGANEIDLNTDAIGVTSGSYALRVTYFIPGGDLGDTTVAAFSDSFEVR